MNKILWPVVFALGLSACSSTPDKPAAVEDHSTAAAPAAPVDKGADTTGIDKNAVSGDADKNKYADPRKDPASQLSKRSVFFDFDKYDVKDDFRPMLEAHAAYLVAQHDKHVVLQGNTDDRGSREYNLALGQKRAEAVRKTLAVLGVPEAQLEAVSFGEEKPRSAGESETDYADNRRTDIVYSDEQ
jgi:peptidoglycan-associated lipoprotein